MSKSRSKNDSTRTGTTLYSFGMQHGLLPSASTPSYSLGGRESTNRTSTSARPAPRLDSLSGRTQLTYTPMQFDRGFPVNATSSPSLLNNRQPSSSFSLGSSSSYRSNALSSPTFVVTGVSFSLEPVSSFNSRDSLNRSYNRERDQALRKDRFSLDNNFTSANLSYSPTSLNRDFTFTLSPASGAFNGQCTLPTLNADPRLHSPSIPRFSLSFQLDTPIVWNSYSTSDYRLTAEVHLSPVSSVSSYQFGEAALGSVSNLSLDGLSLKTSNNKDRFTSYKLKDYLHAAGRAVLNTVTPAINLFRDSQILMAAQIPRPVSGNQYHFITDEFGTLGLNMMVQAVHDNPNLAIEAKQSMFERKEIAKKVIRTLADIGTLSDPTFTFNMGDVSDSVRLEAMRNMSRRMDMVASGVKWMATEASGPELTEIIGTFALPYATVKVTGMIGSAATNYSRFRTFRKPPEFRDLYPGMKSETGAGPLRHYNLSELKNMADASGIYVIDTQGTLIAGSRYGRGDKYFYHSSYAEGKNVVMAGEFYLHDGNLVINNATGHYEAFGPTGTRIAIRKFNELGFENVLFKHYDPLILDTALSRFASKHLVGMTHLQLGKVVTLLERELGPANIYTCPVKKELRMPIKEFLDRSFPNQLIPLSGEIPVKKVNIADEIPPLLKRASFPKDQNPPVSPLYGAAPISLAVSYVFEENKPVENARQEDVCKGVSVSRDGRYLNPASSVCSRLATSNNQSQQTVKISVFHNGLFSVATHGDNANDLDHAYDLGHYIHKETCEIPANVLTQCKEGQANYKGASRHSTLFCNPETVAPEKEEHLEETCRNSI